MTPDDRDLLIHRHLEGSLSEADAAALGALIKTDPAFRRRLAEMAFERAQMREILAAGTTEAVPAARPAASPRFSRRALVPMAAAAIIVLSVGLAVALWSLRQPTDGGVAAPAPDVPKDPFRGFSGPVTGRMASRSESSFRFEVTSVPGQASHPIVGRVILLVAGWTKTPAGEAVSDRTHASFLRKLEADREETIDLRHLNDEIFAIGELTPAQAEWTNRKEDPRRKLPERPRKEGAKDGAEREGQPKDRPKEE